VWERGKWAVYEEGGDRAIMGGRKCVLFTLFFSDGGRGGGKRFVSCVVVGCVSLQYIYYYCCRKYRDCRSRKRNCPQRMKIGNFDLFFGGQVGSKPLPLMVILGGEIG